MVQIYSQLKLYSSLLTSTPEEEIKLKQEMKTALYCMWPVSSRYLIFCEKKTKPHGYEADNHLMFSVLQDIFDNYNLLCSRTRGCK